MFRFFAAVLCACFAVVCAQDFSFRDDFSQYPEGSSPTANWTVPSAQWKVTGGLFVATCESKEFPVIKAAPMLSACKAEAVVTVKKGLADQWKIAGVTIVKDATNYWHVALVEGPKAYQERHFCELSQLYNGEWNYNKNVKMVSESGAQDWKFNVPYRIRIELTPGGISGTIKDMDGKMIFERKYEFTSAAVKSGKPGIDSSFFISEFKEVRAKAQ
ncbi:MAG: hypothetical protein HZC28_05400 [Spirochaetes bacterium]|nr:hypothetical protein [Spirochaetota bacterium]